MPRKKVPMSSKPTDKPAGVDDWVATRAELPEPASQPVQKIKRLTLDIPESLHRKIKMKAVEQGVAMVDMLRELLDKHYGE
jgi:predicted DNA binding CopG/RHH family protein